MADVVLIERPEEHVTVVKLNRPEAHNALSAQLREELAKTFLALQHDESVRCVVLTGSEKVFAAGADIKAMADATPSEMASNGAAFAWQVLRDFPKPVIAAVNGWALGGGSELAMHADIIVAGESARFGQPEIKVGIIPGAGGTQRLTRAVGKFKAMKVLLTGEAVSARDAEVMGLVSEVVPDMQVLERAVSLAKNIAALPPLAARRIKEVVLSGADMPLHAALTLERQAFWLMFDTADQKEGMQAFIEKRSPVYKGI